MRLRKNAFVCEKWKILLDASGTLGRAPFLEIEKVAEEFESEQFTHFMRHKT
jgi:hypothetical protein